MANDNQVNSLIFFFERVKELFISIVNFRVDLVKGFMVRFFFFIVALLLLKNHLLILLEFLFLLLLRFLFFFLLSFLLMNHFLHIILPFRLQLT